MRSRPHSQYFHHRNHQMYLALFLPIHKLFPKNQYLVIIVQMMNIKMRKILMNSVANQYLCSIYCLIIKIAGLRISNFNTVALLLEMVIQVIFGRGRKKF